MFMSENHSENRSRIVREDGVSRFVFILIAAVVVLAIAVTVPLVIYYRSQSKQIGCTAALDTATRQMADRYLIEGFKNEDEVKEWVGFVMNGWDDLCPGGGNIYVVRDENADMPWRLVCGMHGKDKKECCRLNASWVLDRVIETVNKAVKNGDAIPGTVDVKLNGEKLTVAMTEEATGIRRGTRTTKGYDGTVAFFGVSGVGKAGENSGLPEGSVCYFSFADPDYCANWKYGDGWTGTAFK